MAMTPNGLGQTKMAKKCAFILVPGDQGKPTSRVNPNATTPDFISQTFPKWGPQLCRTIQTISNPNNQPIHHCYYRQLHKVGQGKGINQYHR
jgi:hypothetical protein